MMTIEVFIEQLLKHPKGSLIDADKSLWLIEPDGTEFWVKTGWEKKRKKGGKNEYWYKHLAGICDPNICDAYEHARRRHEDGICDPKTCRDYDHDLERHNAGTCNPKTCNVDGHKWKTFHAERLSRNQAGSI